MPGVPPITVSMQDLQSEEGLVYLNDWLAKLVTEVNTRAGLHGPIPVVAPIDMKGNPIRNVGAPVGANDAVPHAIAVAQLGPAAVAPQLEATGSNPLQSVRHLNDQVQRELHSSVFNAQASMVPVTNGSTVSVAAAGANSTITVTASAATRADGSVTPYVQRVDTVANPGAGSNFYYYYRRISDGTLQVVGPFTTNIPTNQINAQLDGREYIATAQVNSGGGGSGGGGGGGSPGACLEVGTPLMIPAGKRWEVEILPCEDWIVIRFEDGKEIVAARDTRIAIFKRVQDLDSRDLAVRDDGEFVAVDSARISNHRSYKMRMHVEGRIYYGARVLFSNFKPFN